jgi:hypothetical protein
MSVQTMQAWNEEIRRLGEEGCKAGYNIDKHIRTDYSIFGVSVVLLGLIMLVEYLRYRVDLCALGHPFMTAVLKEVYSQSK